MFDDVDIVELAYAYRDDCDGYATTVGARLDSCNEKLTEITTYKAGLETVISSLEESKSHADNAASLFDQGAYKDGVTNFADDLSVMSGKVDDSIESLNTLSDNVIEYTDSLEEYIANLTSLKSMWDRASSYYYNHQEEIEHPEE